MQSQFILCQITILLIMVHLCLGIYIMISDPGVRTSDLREKKEPVKLKDFQIKQKQKKFSLILKKIGTAENSKNVLYCRVCNKFLSDCGFHCSSCDVCVEGFLYHSFVLNNCIGKSNVKKYLAHLLVGTVLYSLIIGWVYLITDFDNKTVVYEMVAFVVGMVYLTYFGYNLLSELHAIGSGEERNSFSFKPQNDLKPSKGILSNFWIFFSSQEKIKTTDFDAKIQDQILI